MFLLEEIFLSAIVLLGILIIVKLLLTSKEATTLSLVIYVAGSTFIWLGILIYYIWVDIGTYPLN